MADEADRAEAEGSLHLAAALACRVVEPPMPAQGLCYNCGDALGEGLRFCDTDCMADWKRRSGK